jgi:hypothetical protein
MESFLFWVLVTAEALLSAMLLFVFLLPLRPVEVVSGEAEEVLLTAAAGTVKCLFVRGEGKMGTGNVLFFLVLFLVLFLGP